jgi:uncharacterized protein YrrD
MARNEVNIGAHVKSSDGKVVGTIEQLIVRGESNRAGGFLLAEHRIGGNQKIVPASVVASSDAEQVVLSITEAEVEDLSNFVHEQLVRSPGSLTLPVNSGFVDLRGTGDKWVLHGTDGGQYPHTGSDPFIFEAPIGNVEVMNVSSLPESSVTISEGTDVIGADGDKVGKVDEVFVDDDGQITEFLVRAGWLFKHDVRVPMSLVAGIAHDHVRLNVTAEEAEQQGRR